MPTSVGRRSRPPLNLATYADECRKTVTPPTQPGDVCRRVSEDGHQLSPGRLRLPTYADECRKTATPPLNLATYADECRKTATPPTQPGDVGRRVSEDGHAPHSTWRRMPTSVGRRSPAQPRPTPPADECRKTATPPTQPGDVCRRVSEDGHAPHSTWRRTPASAGRRSRLPVIPPSPSGGCRRGLRGTPRCSTTTGPVRPAAQGPWSSCPPRPSRRRPAPGSARSR